MTKNEKFQTAHNIICQQNILLQHECYALLIDI